MKKFRLSILTLTLLVSTTLHAADINVKPQTKEVLVYLQNAQVSAVAEVSLTPGMHNIILEDLSQYLDENSVQIKGDADFTIDVNGASFGDALLPGDEMPILGDCEEWLSNSFFFSTLSALTLSLCMTFKPSCTNLMDGCKDPGG